MIWAHVARLKNKAAMEMVRLNNLLLLPGCLTNVTHEAVT